MQLSYTSALVSQMDERLEILMNGQEIDIPLMTDSVCSRYYVTSASKTNFLNNLGLYHFVPQPQTGANSEMY